MTATFTVTTRDVLDGGSDYEGKTFTGFKTTKYGFREAYEGFINGIEVIFLETELIKIEKE